MLFLFRNLVILASKFFSNNFEKTERREMGLSLSLLIDLG